MLNLSMQNFANLKGKIKTAFQKAAKHPLGRGAALLMPVLTAILPFTKKERVCLFASGILLSVAAHVGGAYLLPSLEDVAKERDIAPETIAMIDPYLDVKVEDNSFAGYLHAMTARPGLLGIINYFRAQNIGAAHTERSYGFLSPFFPDDFGKKIGETCVINLQEALRQLDTQGQDAYSAYADITHEVRHCAKDQPNSPYHELEANYYADLALRQKFGERAVLHNRIDSASLPKYDHTLYAEFIESGKPLPPVEVLEQASADAWDAFMRITPLRDPAFGDGVYKVDKNSPIYKALSPLAQRRLLHSIGQGFALIQPNTEYQILDDGRVRVYVTGSAQKQPRHLSTAAPGI